MGKAMQDVDPSIKSPLLMCMRQSAASLSVQKAAIQAFRLMSIDEDVSMHNTRFANQTFP